MLEHCAIVTSATEDGKKINACMFPDGCAPYQVNDVAFQQTPGIGLTHELVGYWPPREEKAQEAPAKVNPPSEPPKAPQASPAANPSKKK